MFVKELPGNLAGKRQTSAFTLMEVVMSMAIVALIFSGIITANVQIMKRAEWSGQSLAAQAMAIQQLEQARAALWDEPSFQNQVTNLSLQNWTYNAGVVKGYTWTNLDLPIAGTNNIPATNFVTITLLTNVTGLSQIKLQMVQVVTVWSFKGFGATKLYTNSIATYIGPDNLDPGDLGL